MSLPAFTDSVNNDGYRWWYLDAVSDDGRHALTVIVFIGSVFSPYYARARKRGSTPASAHCAVNVALYGAPWRWCMTERTDASMRRSTDQLSLGKSYIRVDDGKLSVSIDEISVPFPLRVRGRLTINLPDYDLQAVPLDSENPASAQHFWKPVAPQAPITVEFDKPSLCWSGQAYVDSNYGDVPLESSFSHWVWSRSHAPENGTTVLFDLVDQQGNRSQRNRYYHADGTVSSCKAEQTHQLASTRYWRVPRQARTPHGVKISELQTLEDTPFYSRSRFIEHHNGHTQATVHESLYLDRFDSTWVRSLLPFRMPRSTRPVLLD